MLTAFVTREAFLGRTEAVFLERSRISRRVLSKPRQRTHCDFETNSRRAGIERFTGPRTMESAVGHSRSPLFGARYSLIVKGHGEKLGSRCQSRKFVPRGCVDRSKAIAPGTSAGAGWEIRPFRTSAVSPPQPRRLSQIPVSDRSAFASRFVCGRYLVRYVRLRQEGEPSAWIGSERQ